MEAIVRKPASFRLRTDLLESLKKNAARENRTLNNYVESVLLDIVYHSPNDETIAAIKEAKSSHGRFYTNFDNMFNDILDDKK